MKAVHMLYRQAEDGAWIGTSPEVPGYVAHGDTYEQARDRADEGLAWFAERDLFIAHIVLKQGELSSGAQTGTPRGNFSISRCGASTRYSHATSAERLTGVAA